MAMPQWELNERVVRLMKDHPVDDEKYENMGRES